MQYGFTLYIDEAGDEGLDEIRVLDGAGASEYFVLVGVLIQTRRQAELADFVRQLKGKIKLEDQDTIHFRDLDAAQQRNAISEIGSFKSGLICVASNKRNMRRHRNPRIERKHFEVSNSGRVRPQRYNYFYNHLFRYLLETASADCAVWSPRLYGANLPIRVVFSHRRNFSYSQTKAYLHKLRTEKHDRGYFNNKRQINWSVVDPSSIESARARAFPGLQVADCVASAVFSALDEDWFGGCTPEFLEALAPRFLRSGGTPVRHGFILLPVRDFTAPLSADQRRALRAVGYDFTD